MTEINTSTTEPPTTRFLGLLPDSGDPFAAPAITATFLRGDVGGTEDGEADTQDVFVLEIDPSVASSRFDIDILRLAVQGPEEFGVAGEIFELKVETSGSIGTTVEEFKVTYGSLSVEDELFDGLLLTNSYGSRLQWRAPKGWSTENVSA